eukprot:420715-Rhodomonas_salina.1
MGLDPALPWESMRIGLGFREDQDEQPVDLEKMHPQMRWVMDEQMHISSLHTNSSYRQTMEFLQDEVLLDMEDREAFLHCPQSPRQIVPISSLLSLECQNLGASLRFRLLARGESCTLHLLSSVLSSRTWTLQVSYNQRLLSCWTADRKHQQHLFSQQNQQFHLVCNIIDTGCSTPRVPVYPTSELESWTAHLDSVSLASIHLERLHLQTVISGMEPGRKRDDLEGALNEMRKGIQRSRRAELQRTPSRTRRTGLQLRQRPLRLRTLPIPAAATSALLELRIQDDLRLWLVAIEAEHSSHQ